MATVSPVLRLSRRMADEYLSLAAGSVVGWFDTEFL